MSPLVFVFALISILIGAFMPCLIVFILLFFHECGHFLMALLFKFDVDKIYFYPWGGISKFNTRLNVSISQEFIVLVAGPLFQFIVYFILSKTLFSSNYLTLLKNIHYSLLLFNMLPIYPLDGGRLLNLILNCFLSFKRSFFFSFYFSFLVITCFFLWNINNIGINLVFIVLFLFYKIFDEKQKFGFYMDRFLLERYLYNFNFKRLKRVKNIDGFCKGYRHLIYNGNRYLSEKEVLLKKFKK